MWVCVCLCLNIIIYILLRVVHMRRRKEKRRENFFYLPALTTTPAHLCYCCCYLLSPVSALPHKINAPPSTLHPKCIWPYPYIPLFFVVLFRFFPFCRIRFYFVEFLLRRRSQMSHSHFQYLKKEKMFHDIILNFCDSFICWRRKQRRRLDAVNKTKNKTKKWIKKWIKKKQYI
jgi:hypothetical protein